MDSDWGRGGGRGEERGGEDCLNIVINVTSTQDSVITQPWTQGVKSGGDDNPGARLCVVSTVVMGPCSCSRGSLVSSDDSGGATVTLVTEDEADIVTSEGLGDRGGREAGDRGSSMEMAGVEVVLG